MALALILRNATKLPAGVTQSQNYLKVTTIVLNRDFSTLFSNKNDNGNLKLVLPSNQLKEAQVRLMSGDHSKLWPIEKGLSLGLMLVFPAAIAAPNFIFDNLLAAAAVIHFHWGLEACVADYVRPIVVGNILPKLAMGLLYLISATTLGGLIFYNVNDIGIGKTVRKFWAINSESK